MNRADLVTCLHASGAVAVVRTDDPEPVPSIAEALAQGGIHAIEITFTTPGALELISRLSRSCSEQTLIGAGTVLDPQTAEAAIEAGARFVVSPIFRPDIIEAAHTRDVPAVPGAFTATEIQAAWQAGGDIIKVFPASTVGPGYFNALRGPLPHLKLMPTGGVTVENADQWIEAGAYAVGVGGSLLDPDAVRNQRYDVMADRARKMKAGIDAARSRMQESEIA